MEVFYMKLKIVIAAIAISIVPALAQADGGQSTSPTDSTSVSGDSQHHGVRHHRMKQLHQKMQQFKAHRKEMRQKRHEVRHERREKRHERIQQFRTHHKEMRQQRRDTRKQHRDNRHGKVQQFRSHLDTLPMNKFRGFD